MHITVESNQNDGNFHQTVVENIQDILRKGSRVQLIQGEGVHHTIKCNAPLAAEAIEEAIKKGETHIYYHQRFVPLVEDTLIKDTYRPYYVAMCCARKVGCSIWELSQASCDVLKHLSYSELGDLLRGKPCPINFKDFERTFFIPYPMFSVGITPTQFWECMQHRALDAS